MNHIPKPRILLTGGSGFLGTAIAKELLSEDSPVKPAIIRIFDIKPYSGQPDPRIETVRGDVRDKTAVGLACRDIDLVIHAAAVVDWGTHSEDEVLSVNYEGTVNIIEACRLQGIRFLIYTSSLDAIYTGKAMRGIDESIPYPERHPNMYCESKCRGEKAVLEANGTPTGKSKEPGDAENQESWEAGGRSRLLTCVLRPSDIYGEGDPFHIGSLVNMARGGFYVRLGNGKARSQHVYVGNMAWAHILAAARLMDGSVPGGQVYFISDAPPSNFFHFFDRIVEASGYRIWPKNLWIPKPIAWTMGVMAEVFALLIRPFKNYTPKFSRFAVVYTCNDFTFETTRARDELGFIPKYSQEEAFRRTVESVK